MINILSNGGCDWTSPVDKKIYVEKVQNALVSLGYPERIARKRCKILGGIVTVKNQRKPDAGHQTADDGPEEGL